MKVNKHKVLLIGSNHKSSPHQYYSVVNAKSRHRKRAECRTAVPLEKEKK